MIFGSPDAPALRRTRNTRRGVLLLAVASLVVSCGKKGGLRLPEDEEEDE